MVMDVKYYIHINSWFWHNREILHDGTLVTHVIEDKHRIPDCRLKYALDLHEPLFFQGPADSHPFKDGV